MYHKSRYRARKKYYEKEENKEKKRIYMRERYAKNKIADLEEALKSKDYFEKPDYKFLVDENHRLEQQYLEVKADNMKLARQVDDQINKLREAGLL